MSNLSGQSLGRYHILEPLGEGGMAIVYKAYDTRLENEVAVKVIRTERLSPEILQKALKRFEREAKSLAQLTHPNIVHVLDYGEHAGQPYLVMPYVPGGTLKQLLNGKPMPWQRAARLLIPIARALDYAHKRGIVHRDIKPSNIMITESGEPMLTDFGVAKIIDEEATLDLTGTNATVGTPEYMAPEQVNSKTTDYRVDIYALGIVLYEMVTGRRPFEGDTPLATLFKQATDPLPRPSLFVKGIPESIEMILVKALAKKPADRYQNMGEVANALDALSSGNVSAPKPSRPIKESASSSTPVRASRRPIALWASLGMVGIAVIGMFISRIVKNVDGIEVIPTNTSSFTETPLATKASLTTSTPVATNTLLVTATPELEIGSTRTGKDGMTLLYVPAGEFIMGSDVGWIDVMPIHTLYLDAYWIDQTEVTNLQYSSCVMAGKCTPPSEIESRWRSNYYGNSQFDSYPVVYVDWNMAKTYCEWADRRLPTEAEWEKAARGIDGRTYPWGEGIDCNHANYWGEDNGNRSCVDGSDTTAIGGYDNGKSPYGAYDMAGNVSEWVNDWYSESYYKNSPLSNPLGPDLGQRRVFRGGNWSDDSDRLRSAYRLSLDPFKHFYYYIGFRCALSVP